MHLIMDRAYEGNETTTALDLGFISVVPLAWVDRGVDRAMYRRRNEVERLFRRLKGYRRIFSASRSSTS
jgi:transposase